MSGGVDSSVAAALLLDKGYEVTGITMNLFSLLPKYCHDPDLHSCCGLEAITQAAQVAKSLGIPHYVINMKKEFRDNVISDFCSEYASGRTPNPCIRCNEFIKFSALWGRSKNLKADYIATGHHARISQDSGSSRFLLKKGADKDKDQSYFLYCLTQKQLASVLFPVGDLTKSAVRDYARKRNLPVAEKPESQEICFIPDNDYVRFLEEEAPETMKPGLIVDVEGKVMGNHNGVANYTIGQRKGLGISSPHPLYVLEIRPQENTIVVGEDKHLYQSLLLVSQVNLISPLDPKQEYDIKARIRYKHLEAPARLTLDQHQRAQVEFEKPQRAVTPGQSVVFYDGDTVLGGGIIEAQADMPV